MWYFDTTATVASASYLISIYCSSFSDNLLILLTNLLYKASNYV